MNARLLLAALVIPAAFPALADCWQPDAAASEVRFAATQAGAPIEGTFRSFTGRICLDEGQPDRNAIDVTIDTGSVDMGLPEFDEAMRGAEFFDTAHWPAARFISTSVTALGSGRYAAAGRFTIRDRTRDVEVPFTLSGAEGTPVIAGETAIRRLDYDIGLGQWRDTRWVGDEVTLRFSVTLRAEDNGAGATAPAP
ncbi:MAG: YceI family protein [Gammaproteobacteria bacterium]|nr:YceI family protein [Gammaproteobacteria bacterium]